MDRNHRKVRVLIVDDTPDVRCDLRQFLDLTGDLEVIGEAANGLEAIRLTAELSPDVVVMDLEMPVMDGFQATRQIKAQVHAPRIVILSIHAGMEERQRAMEAGADAFFMKGNSYDALVRSILGVPSGNGKE